MIRMEPYQHLVKKEGSILDYLNCEDPNGYVKIRTEFKTMKKVITYYTNIMPVYVGHKKNIFGLPLKRKKVVEKGKYSNFTYISRNSKNIPSIPKWARLTGYEFDLSEWHKAVEYTNDETLLITETFNEKEEKYEESKIEVIKENLQLKRKK